MAIQKKDFTVRLEKITPFMVMEILKESSRLPDTIHFEIGQPDLPPPPDVEKMIQKALKSGIFGYTESGGLYDLKNKISRFYRDFFNVKVPIERIIITPGSSGAFTLIFSLALDYGEKLALCDPGYPSYKNIAYVLNIDPVFIKTGPENRFNLTPELLLNKDFKTLCISNPSNPTGSAYTPKEIKKLYEYLKSVDKKLIVDELYQGLIYDSEPFSALAISEEIFVVGGFSKFFCMPGLRLGWAIIPENLVDKAEMIAQNLFISPPTLSQYGALGAFDYTYLQRVSSTFKKRRDFLYSELKKIFHIPYKPDGAFYIWADISKYGVDSMKFAKEMLHKTKVAVTPGTDFSRFWGDRYLRFSFTSEITEMEKGIKRIKEFVKGF